MPSRSIHPSQPRNRAIFAALCATLFGAVVLSGFIRACEGDDFWEGTTKKSAAPKNQSAPNSETPK
jgi:hypothetical protein